MVQKVVVGNLSSTREQGVMKLKQFVSNRERTLMRKIIQIVVCMGAMLSLQAGATSQDFDDAVSAYKSGRTDIAVQKFTSAAYAGDSVAQGLLGSMYLFGAPGVPENHREAVKWTRLAATKGDTVAQYNLAHIYTTGKGVPQNPVKAYVWANLAVSGLQSYDKPEYVAQFKALKAILSESLTPAQLEAAQKMSTDCLKRDFKGCD